MPESVESLVDAHLKVWNGPDGPDRAESIALIYAPDVFIGEPGFAHTGQEGMAKAISGLQDQAPGTVLTRSGPIQVAQDLVTYSWKLGPAGGDTIVTGRDVLIIRDQRISSLYVVIDAPE
ncbi:hypothetical protein AB0O14_13035 [Microbacterium foliorum]|jgi:hypothetical protein